MSETLLFFGLLYLISLVLILAFFAGARDE